MGTPHPAARSTARLARAPPAPGEEPDGSRAGRTHVDAEWGIGVSLDESLTGEATSVQRMKNWGGIFSL